MQSQQEQHSTTSQMASGTHPQYSTIQDDYGWLTKLNFLVIACFGMAFLILDNEARWISAVGLFFCFMLIFVLNALSKQQQMIVFQQRQIQDLLQIQHLNAAKELSKDLSFDHSNTESENLHRQEQNTQLQVPEQTTEQISLDPFDQTFSPNNGAEFLHDPILSDQQNISTASSLNSSNLVDANEKNADVEDDFVKASEYAAASQARYEHSQKVQSSSVLSNPSEQHTENTLLKDLKGMTSLWSAFIEWFKGGNSIVRIAIIILLIGFILLLRFASEYWQPTLSIKMTGIAVAGGALTTVGYWLRNKRYGYAISIQGAGLGILFLVLFSAFKLAVITSVGLSYGLLIGLLAVTLLLALKQNALILAFIALGSGFVAPFILNTGSNNMPALFSYYLALNIALAVIAFFKPWRILNTISLLATFGVGGLSIWLKAQPEQYGMLSILVWLHFALYLFISIRYSQNIAQYKIAFKNIPLIDTALIFATPFMAFTLYAGLVYHNQTALSVASAVLALVYFVVGYVLHKKSQALTLLIQSFYGLGLTFLALILPFAFDAQWTSTGWAVQALALIWMGCRHHLKNSVLYGLVLLGASSAFWLKSILYDGNLSALAVSFLTLAYLASAYIFSTPELNEKLINDDLDHIDTDHVLATTSTQQFKNSVFLNNIMQSATLGCLLILQVVVALYCFMADQNDVLMKNAELMAVLTLASTVIAVCVFQVQQLSKNMQLFAGCALLYFAMIPLILWQTNVISIWWTLQALIMLIVTSLYAVSSIRNASTILLWASAVCAFNAIIETQNLRYIAVIVLILASTVMAYWLWCKAKPLATQTDRIAARLNLALSFMFVPYVVYKLCDLMNQDLYSIALPMLLWWGILTLIYRFKHQVLDQVWLSLSMILLFIGISEIGLLSTFAANDFQLWAIESVYQIPMLITIGLWFVVFIFCLKIFAKQVKLFWAQFFMLMAVILMAVFGGLLAWNQLAFIPMLLLLPVVVLLASFKVKPLQFLQSYWHGNISIAIVGGVSIWLISLLQNGQWNLPYITLLNPMDALSIGIFVICIFAMKPLIQTQRRELQIANMAIMIVTGLMLISSVMLRSLHHYMNLPYWSVEAWQNGMVQASLTILWVILSLVLTTFASKKALRHVWMLGIAVLALVIAKLIFLDLSHTHTITRIVSFIGSGLVMLVIGYFAPLPPAQKTVDQLAEGSEKSQEQSKD